MNPRNRDARRLRAVRRPHSLIHTLSIRPSSKFNDDTSSFSVRLSSSFQSQIPREMSTSGPGTPIPRHKYETSCHTCRPQRPVLPCQLWVTVMCKALPNRLGFAWCKRTSNSLSVCLVSSPGHLGSGRILQLWGLDKGSIPGGSRGEVSCFVPICLRCMFLHHHGEDADPDRVVATERLEMNALLPHFYGRGHNIWMESVCAWCSAEGRKEQDRTGQDRAKAWLTLLAMLYGF